MVQFISETPWRRRPGDCRQPAGCAKPWPCRHLDWSARVWLGSLGNL